MTAAVDVFLVSRFLLPVSCSLVACFEKVVRTHHSFPFPCRVTRAYMTRVSWPLALALPACSVPRTSMQRRPWSHDCNCDAASIVDPTRAEAEQGDRRAGRSAGCWLGTACDRLTGRQPAEWAQGQTRRELRRLLTDMRVRFVMGVRCKVRRAWTGSRLDIGPGYGGSGAARTRRLRAAIGWLAGWLAGWLPLSRVTALRWHGLLAGRLPCLSSSTLLAAR
jgi:hypothetical protein